MITDAPGWLQALVLGVVQGLTEFLPVSSSAHLVLVPALAGWERHGLAFDVALHGGTLLALVVYYRDDLWRMLVAVVVTRDPADAFHRRLAGLLILASVPVAVVGITLARVVEAAFDAPEVAAALLLVTAAVLVGAERVRHHRLRPDRVRGDGSRRGDADASTGEERRVDLELERLGWRQAAAIGMGQALALLPGLSRSGLTIAAGVAVGLSRPAAARFAFLLSVPAVAGAIVVQFPALDEVGGAAPAELAIGVGAAAVSGYLAISLLVKIVARSGLDRFAWYLVPVALVGLVALS